MAISYQEVAQKGLMAGYGVSCVRFPTPSARQELADVSDTSTSLAAIGDVERKLGVIIKHRRARQKHFPGDLFADPAWDILLDLALAELQQRRVSISSLCIGAQVPQTTALRWIKHMTDNGWLIRRDDPLDARRKFIELSLDASSKMRAYIESLDEVVTI